MKDDKVDQIEELSDGVVVLKFDVATIPVFKETPSKKWITYGEKDDYAEYLLKLYKRSERHRAIIKNKVKYIIGKGFKPLEKNDKADEWLLNANDSGETIDDVFKKCTSDYEIFSGFFLEIIWNKGRTISSIRHISFNKLKSNKDNSLFFYKNNWKDSRESIQEIPAFDRSKPTGKQLLFFKEYEAGLDTYPLPEYVACTTIIEADIEVSTQILNNAKSGFSPNKLINFPKGEPDKEARKELEKGIKEKFTGAKGDKIILNFSKGGEAAPTVLDLGESALTKENFANVDALIEQKIFSGHQVVSKMLFGVAQAGQLGGSDQLRESYEIFKNTYANDKQQILERIVNMLSEINGIDTEFKIQHIDPIPIIIDSATASKAMDRDEIREKIGLAPEGEEKIRNKFIRSFKQLPDSVGTKVLNSMTDDEIRALVSLPPLPDGSGNITTKMRKEAANKAVNLKKDYSEEEAADLFSTKGVARENFILAKKYQLQFKADQVHDFEASEQLYFEELAAIDISILELINKDKLITPETISESLKISVDVANAKLENLKEEGYLKTKGKKGSIERSLTEPLEDIKDSIKSRDDSPKIFVKYSYEVRPDAGEEIIDGTRPFCKKLIELDRLYTRQEIEKISEKLGYSVWDRRGGFWTQPDGTVSPSCRHIWLANVLIKK